MFSTGFLLRARFCGCHRGTRQTTVSSRRGQGRNQHMVWDEETIRLLRALWAEGLSTAEIGRRLGVSKNAIVGKAHRLDLDARPSHIRRETLRTVSADGPVPALSAGATLPPLPSHSAPSAPVQAATGSEPSQTVPSAVPSAPAAPVASPAPARLVTPVAAPIARLVPHPAPAPIRRSNVACCWPIGEPGTKGFRFCDESSVPGKPYCEEHVKLAYVRVKDRKEDAA
ncbi:MAG TPA: GcrA family cell cycle regulator [Rhodopila sp.]|nr:GcrA family cell cycle regulator [Rhodopila sp.]